MRELPHHYQVGATATHDSRRVLESECSSADRELLPYWN